MRTHAERFLPVFAQQGYFVIMINPTGSTTFGQGLCSTRCQKTFPFFYMDMSGRIYRWYWGRLGRKAFR